MTLMVKNYGKLGCLKRGLQISQVQSAAPFNRDKPSQGYKPRNFNKKGKDDRGIPHASKGKGI